MPFRPDDLAARHEAFRRLAPTPKAGTFGPEFDRAFEAWDAKRRFRKRVFSLLALVAVAAIGGVLVIRFSPLAMRDACLDPDGRQFEGTCAD